MGDIHRRLEDILKATHPDVLAKEGFKTFVPVTPIDSGAARRNTRVSGPEIHADYAYAGRLNRGWSNQSRGGMAQPTIDAVREYIKKL